MDTTQFKQHLQELSLSYAQFAEIIGTSASNIKISLKRGKVPEAWQDTVTKRLQTQVVTAHEPVTNGELQTETVTTVTRSEVDTPTDQKTKVLRLSAEPGHPEWDIMADGFARGFPGDSQLMRAWYRTPSAYRRICEALNLDSKTTPIVEMRSLPHGFKVNREGKPTTQDGKVIKVSE